ncbi:hypothetical protein J5N97_021690 [Dioscorea zingiberensis]|uniref:Peptidase S8/S53 domain-containing protein n=1 Tax=Dioscorea zingiberensis TaxID=325984 RepID=A0A9D5C9T0_9LILI|nr:hypothetical protein J5N97_021690 [Dioscorea zingiberensis]
MMHLFAFLFFSSLPFPTEASLKEYIVQVQRPMGLTSDEDILEYYHSFLPKTVVDIDDRKVIDNNGHGTYTTTTTTGNFVMNANVPGNGNGTTFGIAPLAHIAIYKVCEEKIFEEHDIIARMDAAIGDRVDVISISLGNQCSFEFYIDGIAIATYRAAKNGIFCQLYCQECCSMGPHRCCGDHG